MELEKVKEKVNKLLALASSPNEAEAMSALHKAEAFMAEYNLSKADCAFVTENKEEKLRISTWKKRLMFAIAYVHNCFVVLHTSMSETWQGTYAAIGKCYQLSGRPQNCMISSLMYDYLVSAIDRSVAKIKNVYQRNSVRKAVADIVIGRIFQLGKNCSWMDDAEERNSVKRWFITGREIAPTGKIKPESVPEYVMAQAHKLANGISLNRQASSFGEALMVPHSDEKENQTP